MTKNKFLKELEKNLHVLDVTERQDILDEYRDIIEEKVKHGKTEKEAVEEFGSIEELSREILSAYKVNPDYSKKEDDLGESAKKLGSEFDNFVKKGAKKATEFSKELVEEIKVNNDDITIEFVFELLFKGVATLIIMFIASLPFLLVREIGSNILDIMIYPLNHVLVFIWSLFVMALFIGCCFLIFIAMFKQYFRKGDIKVKVVTPTGTKKKEAAKKKEKQVQKEVEELEKELDNLEHEEEVEKEIIGAVATDHVKTVKPKREKNGTPLLDIFLAIAKAFMIVMMIPLIMFNIAIFVGVIVVIYLIIKGLMIPGALIGGIGMLIFFGYLQSMLFNVIFRHKKIHVYPYIIGIIMCVIGGILMFDQAINMNYYDQVPENNFETAVLQDKVTVKTDRVYLRLNDSEKITYQVNETLLDNEIAFEFHYKKELLKVDMYTNTFDNRTGKRYDEAGNYIEPNETDMATEINVYTYSNVFTGGNKKLRKLFIDNFKDNKIYNYGKLSNIDVTIYTNSKTKAKLVNLEEILIHQSELGD